MSSEVSLPHLESYTEAEIQFAISKSTALERYLRLSQLQPVDTLQKLRIERHKAWLLCALATLLNKSTARDVCLYWSHAADKIAKQAWVESGCAKFNLALFALGKWGSQELNLSSDIDIVIVSQESPTEIEYRCARDFIHLLANNTEFGFCFRVDTDLKPGGRLAPLISSTKLFEDYYWSSGETWEKLALVRMRAIVGQPQIIDAIGVIVEKFIFRKHIDFSLLQDLKHLRAKIHAHYPQNIEDVRNLKLSPGGIRDIELFIHALQVIHGGKLKQLRTTSTTLAAEELKNENRFTPSELDYLISTYWRFRELENKVQALDDRQTHTWSKFEHGTKEFEFFVTESARVGQIVEHLLGKAQSSPGIPLEAQAQKVWLQSLGYSDFSIETKLPELLSLTALSTRTLQDEDIRLRVIRKFIEELAAVALDKDLGFALLIDFFKSTRAKATFFSLLATETRLIHELSVLFGCSPYLGGILASRPELIDSYLYRAQAKVFDNFEQLLESLAERKLINEIISANQFLQSQNLEQLLRELTLSADDICVQLLEALKNEFGDSTLRILTLGKWGGHEMGLRSDLDFIFVTDEAPNTIDQKISKRFLSRLTEHHRGGAIYDFDMRLRPSGKGGPLLVSRQQLLDYLKGPAAAWERQSYLRARTLPIDLEFDQAIHVECAKRRLNHEDLIELQKIQSQLLREANNKIEIKYAPGGLIDIELAAQAALMLDGYSSAPTDTVGMLRYLADHKKQLEKHSSKLALHYNFLRLVEQLYQLVSQHPASTLDVSSESFTRISKLLNIEPSDLDVKLRSYFYQNTIALKSLDPRGAQK